MTTPHDPSRVEPKPGNGRRPFLTTSAGRALCVFLAVAGLVLWFEHRAHVVGAVPILLPLLICVGTHVFLHRGHGGPREHGDGHDER